MQRYTDVHFEFLSAGAEPRILRGTVIVRDNEMVLEAELPGDRPYLIRGKKHEGFFQGVHEGLVDDVPVHAKWTRLDNNWIGTWLEDGIDYLFTFGLASTNELAARRVGMATRTRGK